MRLADLPRAERRAVRAALACQRAHSPRRPRGYSALETDFQRQVKFAGLQDGMQREYRFHPLRKWRLDFAWPERRIGVEIDGAIWAGARGGHTSGTGRVRDMEKGNAAALLGWRVLELAPAHVHDGRDLTWLRELLEGAPA